MMRILLLLIAICLAAPAFAADFDPASDPVTAPWAKEIHQAAERFGVPESWISEVIRQESGGHAYNAAGRPMTSWTGAMGLMQIMPSTYAMLRQRYDLGADPYDPANNIMAGTAYIREMYERFGAPGFLAAYNAGPLRAASYMAGMSNLPRETENYLARVAPRLGRGQMMPAAPGGVISLRTDQPMPPDLIDAVLHSGGLGSGMKPIKNTEDPSARGPVEFQAPLLIPASAVVGPLKPVTDAIKRVSRADVEAALRRASGAAYAVHSWVRHENEAATAAASALATDAVATLKPRFANDNAVAPDDTARNPVAANIVPVSASESEIITQPAAQGDSAGDVQTISYQPAPPPAAPQPAEEPTIIAEAPVPLPANLGRTPGAWAATLGNFADPSLVPMAMKRLGTAIGKPFGRLQKLVKSVDRRGVRVYQAQAIGLTVSDATSLCDAMIRRNLDCVAVPPEQ